MKLEATPETCPHDLSGATSASGLRRIRELEEPSHVSECVRCHTKVYVILDRTGALT